jgi:hypothetical protein
MVAGGEWLPFRKLFGPSIQGNARKGRRGGWLDVFGHDGKDDMAKVIALILLAAMFVQMIKPLGLPGLRKRSDFWKVAVIAIAAMMLTAMVRPG